MRLGKILLLLLAKNYTVDLADSREIRGGRGTGGLEGSGSRLLHIVKTLFKSLVDVPHLLSSS